MCYPVKIDTIMEHEPKTQDTISPQDTFQMLFSEHVTDMCYPNIKHN